MEYIAVSNLAGLPFRTRHLGLDYVIARVTLISPGVLSGSQGSLLYEEADMAASVGDWEGKPITLNHPEPPLRGDSPEVTRLGWVRNARMENGRLVAEAWFLVNAVRNHYPELLSQIEAGKPVEVSTGLQVAVEFASGVDHRGRPYDRIARNYRPDHLAVLVGQVGACSVRDGCGVNNERKEEMCTCNNRVATDQADLIPQCEWDFANPCADKQPAAVQNRAATAGSEEVMPDVVWEFPNPVQ